MPPASLRCMRVARRTMAASRSASASATTGRKSEWDGVECITLPLGALQVVDQTGHALVDLLHARPCLLRQAVQHLIFVGDAALGALRLEQSVDLLPDSHLWCAKMHLRIPL